MIRIKYKSGVVKDFPEAVSIRQAGHGHLIGIILKDKNGTEIIALPAADILEVETEVKKWK